MTHYNVWLRTSAFHPPKGWECHFVIILWYICKLSYNSISIIKCAHKKKKKSPKTKNPSESQEHYTLYNYILFACLFVFIGVMGWTQALSIALSMLNIYTPTELQSPPAIKINTDQINLERNLKSLHSHKFFFWSTNISPFQWLSTIPNAVTFWDSCYAEVTPTIDLFCWCFITVVLAQLWIET